MYSGKIAVPPGGGGIVQEEEEKEEKFQTSDSRSTLTVIKNFINI
jgi:hypothetical protein